MPSRNAISVPLSVLAAARYAAVGDRLGSTRPTGSGFTGSDIQLWWALLDFVRAGDRDNVIVFPQSALNAIFGRVHPDRLAAAMERLRGTDAIVGLTVIPCLVSASRTGSGQEPRTWTVKLDYRAIDLVKRGPLAEINVAALRQLSSRYSIALYGRLVAWRNQHYPANTSILFGAHPAERAFQADVPSDLMCDVFGFYGKMRPSDVERLLVTDSKTCPLRRELWKASVAVDTVLRRDEISPSRFTGLRVRISEVLTEGIADIKAAERHRKIRSTHSKRLYEQRKAAEAAASAPIADNLN